MYEYKVTPLGDMRALRRRRPEARIEETPGDEAELFERVLNEMAETGWRLVAVVSADPRGFLSLCIFERKVVEGP